MTDRLTQLQLCLDQLLDIMFSAISFVDQNHDVIPANINEPKAIDPTYNPPSEFEFQASQNELAVDIILKTRQILKIIDTLPGVGVTKNEQLLSIRNLRIELEQAEKEKADAVERKDKLLGFVNQLILQVSGAIAESR